VRHGLWWRRLLGKGKVDELPGAGPPRDCSNGSTRSLGDNALLYYRSAALPTVQRRSTDGLTSPPAVLPPLRRIDDGGRFVSRCALATSSPPPERQPHSQPRIAIDDGADLQDSRRQSRSANAPSGRPLGRGFSPNSDQKWKTEGARRLNTKSYSARGP